MQKLNKKATQIFCDLLTHLDKGYKQFLSGPFMPLKMENFGEAIGTPWGIGRLYSLRHCYEQEGNLLVDPEMRFIVIDNRTADTQETELVSIYPYYFKAVVVGYREEESAHIENYALTTYYPKDQAEHRDFAQSWLVNIEQQGYLNSKS